MKNRDIPRGLAAVVGVRGTYVAYATAPGAFSSDGAGRNGLFTGHLVENIKKPSLKIEDMFKLVRVDTISDKNNFITQTPWDASSLRGDFYFKPAGSVIIVANKPNVEIYLDDRLVGKSTGAGQLFRVSNLEPGHKARIVGKLSEAGKQDLVRDLMIRENEEIEVVIGDEAETHQPKDSSSTSEASKPPIK